MIFSPRLSRRLKRIMSSLPKTIADEDDIANSVFASFWWALCKGRYMELASEEDVWRLLCTISTRRVIDYQRRLSCRCRHARTEPIAGVDLADPRMSSPDSYAVVKEQFANTMSSLDPQTRMIARAKMEGCSNAEIAQEANCSVRTILRRIARLKTHFSNLHVSAGAS